jgi:C4-dicarboxylate-specific signal transduction histidine kinase
MSPNSSTPSGPTSLERALDQNEIVRDTVENSADELLLINAVLKQKIPGHAQTDELAQALQKGDELEDRIQESAESLARVNLVLEQEIAERADLERKLAAARAALGQSGAGDAAR